MEHQSSAAQASTPDARIQGHALERQLRLVERHYAEACCAACDARDEWRAMTIHPGAKPEQVSAVRAKFEAVAARCLRLRAVIDELEYRLDY